MKNRENLSFSELCAKFGCSEGIYSTLENDMAACSPLIAECAKRDARINAGAFSTADIVPEDAVISEGVLRKAVFRVAAPKGKNEIRGAIIYEKDRKTAVLRVFGTAACCVITALEKNGVFSEEDIIFGESAEDYLRSRLPFYTARLAKREKQRLALFAAVTFAAVVIAFSLWYLFFGSGTVYGRDIPEIIELASTSRG